MFGYDPEVFKGVKMLRQKYDLLRKGIEDICTSQTNSTAGLDGDDMAIALLKLLKKDNKLNLDNISSKPSTEDKI